MRVHWLIGIFAILFSGIASAHPGHVPLTDFRSGFLHPLTGADHLLGIFAVGVWSSRQKMVSSMGMLGYFLLSLLAGVMMGAAKLEIFSGVDSLLAASLITVGLLLGFRFDLKGKVQALLTTLFGFLHGLAHGMELGHSNGSIFGMLLATTLLLGLGFYFAKVTSPEKKEKLNSLLAIALVSLGSLIIAT
jgi:urease accessory protein